MTSSFQMIIFLTLIWCGFSQELSLKTLLSGALVATISHRVFRSNKKKSTHFCLFPFISLLFFTIKQLCISSIEVAKEIIILDELSSPQIIEIPLSCRDSTEILLLSNIISLTPGTLVIDVLDSTSIQVHAMFAKDKDKIYHFIKHILEPKVMKVFNHG